MKHETEFQDWLVAQNYQVGTVRSTVRMVRRAMEAHAANESLDKFEAYLRRWLSFVRATGVPVDAFTAEVASKFDSIEPRPHGDQGDKKPLTQAEWRALTGALSKSDHPTDLALRALLSLPHPASELQQLLTMPMLSLRAKLPVQVEKELYSKLKASSLSELVCPGGSYACAYLRLYRRLASYQTGLDFQSIERTPWAVRS